MKILPSPDHVLAEYGLPGNPSKINRISDTLFIDFWSQNDSQNGPKNTIKPSCNPDRNPTLFFSHFGTPNGAHKPRKQQYYLGKNKHFHKSSLCLLIIVLAPTSFPKHAQNHSKTTQKNIPKTYPNLTPNLIYFGLQMTPKTSTKILHKSTWGHYGPHGTLRNPKRRSRPPRGTKRDVQGPSRAPFLSLLGTIFNVFQ